MLIALIFKVAHAPSIVDYRLISCYTMVYKVISKILTVRMAGVIDIQLGQELLRKYARK